MPPRPAHHGLLWGVAVLMALARAGAMERPHFAGGDLEDRAVRSSLVRWAVEREVVLVSTNEAGLGDAVATMLQLRRLGVFWTLVHGTSAAVCAAVYAVVPDGACAWTSWKPAGIVGAWSPSNFRTVLFVARKQIVYRLACEEGLGVLQTDTDTVWFTNPFVLFNSHQLRRFDVIVQRDVPFVNAGVMYVRRATNGTGAAYIVRELLQTLERFSGSRAGVLSAVRAVRPNAKKVAGKVENEQMHLNDIVASAALGRRIWSSSIGRIYAATGDPCMHCDEASKQGFSKTYSDVHALSSSVSVDLCAAGPRPKMVCTPERKAQHWSGLSVPIRDAGLAGGGSAPPTGLLLIASNSLFSHLNEYRGLVAASRPARCQALALEAAGQSGRFSLPVVAMLHLSALASVKHQRAAVLQALGYWDARADLVGKFVGRGSSRVLSVTNFQMGELQRPTESSGVATLLVQPLLQLASLAGRQPALPSIPCATVPAWGTRDRAAIVVPNSDCASPASPDDAQGGECVFLSSQPCHELILSSMELERLGQRLAANASAHRGTGVLSVPFSQLVERSGAHGDLAARAKHILGSPPARLVLLDGGGAPISALARLLSGLGPSRAVRAAGGDGAASLTALCRTHLRDRAAWLN